MNETATFTTSAGPEYAGAGIWPTPDQELILKAALQPGDVALPAWRQWRERVNLAADLEPGTFRLLPLLYRRVTALGEPHDEVLRRLGGVYKWAWVEAQRKLRYMLPVLRSLHEAGFRTMLLKGATLAHCFYQSPSTRPMADFDVLVQHHVLDQVARHLESIGWRERSAGALGRASRYCHATTFVNADNEEFDLHWYVAQEFCDAQINAAFWARSVPIVIEGVPTSRLDTTDSLLHIVVHGVRWNPEPPIRWIADAITVIRHQDPIDWARIVRICIDRKLMNRFGLGMRYLHDRMGIEIPESARRRHPASWLEMVERSAFMRPPPSSGVFVPINSLWRTFGDYLRYAEQCTWSTNIGFLKFLALYKHVDRRRDLGPYVVHKLKRRGLIGGRHSADAG